MTQLESASGRSIPHNSRKYLILMGAVSALCLAPVAAQAQSTTQRGVAKLANPHETGDGTRSPAAAAAMARGYLSLPADLALKAAADAKADTTRRLSPESPSAAAGGPQQGPQPLGPSGDTPQIVGGINIAGLADSAVTPPDTTGAIGPASYVQLVNRQAGIFDRGNGTLISAGTLNQLANLSSTVNVFDVQIIWDPTTNRFYYVMDAVFSSTDNRLAIGFSRTATPTNVTSDWCHYTIARGARFPDYPKLGDSSFFMIIGVNAFTGSPSTFAGSDLFGVIKPSAGTTCPTSLSLGVTNDLRTPAGARVFTPVPANQIDSASTGYVVARNLFLPSTTLWFFNVTRNSTNRFPIFGPGRAATVASYTIPASATQPSETRRLDTLDARNTQAVQAVDPFRGTFSFWTQQTIGSGTLSAVRFYEINPVPTPPVVLRQQNISDSTSFFFNGAISPDRRVAPGVSAFGNSFAIQYNVSGALSGIFPRIVAGSGVDNLALQFLLVQGGVGPYRDFSCATTTSTCRWGDYSGATPDPDPNPAFPTRGVVWGTSQFSGVLFPATNVANWRTKFFAVKP